MVWLEARFDEITVGYNGCFWAYGIASKAIFENGDEWPGHEMPYISDYEVELRAEVGGETPWESYASACSDCGWPITSRSPDVKIDFNDAKGLIWVPEPKRMSIELPVLSNTGFESVMMGVASAKMGLDVSLYFLNFSPHEYTLAPSVDGFLKRREPLFFHKMPIFKPVHIASPMAKTKLVDESRRRAFSLMRR